MSESSPTFYAWCNEADRVDAFVAALSALVRPGGACTLWMLPGDMWHNSISLDEAVAVLRASFVTDTYLYASFGVELSSGRVLSFSSHCYGEGHERRGASGPLTISPFDKEQLIPEHLAIAFGGARSVEVEAAIAFIVAQPDVEDVLLRFCAPDAATRVTTGGCTKLWDWVAPIEMDATYHADASSVACDLALSWVHLHDKDKMERTAGMSLDALHARVDAAPHGARVAVAGGGELSRETVLKALSTPPAALLDALEACALPDDEWSAVEPRALEVIEAMKAGMPTYKVDLTTRKHVQFIERHAPYHVRRLPNGGVLLATHPYRTLWQLYADALFLLGITP
ncbi:MAG: hypothetical protein ABI134_01450 [Byssovorax sp.]